MISIRLVRSVDDHSEIDLRSFLVNAKLSSLRSIADQGLRPYQRLILALDEDHSVVGCTSYIPGTAHRYIDMQNTVAEVEGALLCSTEVASTHQGRGIGSALYRERLRRVRRESMLVVEILGSGVLGSVDPRASRGLTWHVGHHFSPIGYSLEDDHGPVLARRRSVSSLGGSSRPS